MKQHLQTICLLLLCAPCHAQWHDMNWFFGTYSEPPYDHTNGSLLRFDSNELQVSSIDLQLNLEGSALVASDAGGEFIFYSNGLRMHDASDELMPNGDSLNIGIIADEHAACQSCSYIHGMDMLALPFDSIGLYAIIHLSVSDTINPGTFPSRPIPYALLTMVDMGLNNGLGDVTIKDQLVVSSWYLAVPAAVRHANGRDWWVVIPEFSDSLYWRILVTQDGIGEVGSQVTGIAPTLDSIPFNNGQGFFTKDGSKYINAGGATGVKIFDFDRCTGMLSNMQLIYEMQLPFNMAISPSTRFLYVGNFTQIYQYDLWAPDIAASAVQVATWDGSQDEPNVSSIFNWMHPGPDGRIYIMPGHPLNKSLHVINFPDKKGLACDVRQRHVQLPHAKGGDFTLFPNYRLAPLDGSPCDTLGLDSHPLAGFRCEALPGQPLTVEFTDNSYYGPTTWAWDFGDGEVSQDTSPVHAFPGPGTYLVCLTVANQFGEDTWCKQVTITATDAKAPSLFEHEVAISPNPTSYFIQVKIPDGLPSAVLKLYTVTGQPVFSRHLSTNRSIVPMEDSNGQEIAPGLYFYELRDEGRVLQTGKLVKVE